ncbi:VWA domain-containing protein [Rossellomorea vietnamensis]|uniref:vWA domain-containing protein n=1 Tax=Rossellomorea vietnamensis TaxID=218284 RepID=UPI001CCDC1F3|nr:VWA domain-containing protein [Rossellomorea vietnamensis]MCA0149893.1 VWA domain-containing protein [Rossellomorea vietnamensis]
MKKVVYTLIVMVLLVTLAACNSKESATSQSEEKEPKKEDKVKKDKEANKKTEEIDKDYPPVPTTFSESAEYPTIGEFSGNEYEKGFTGEEDIKKKLDSLPKLTEESSKEDIEKMQRYVYSLFKEDLTKVDVPIDQWKSMQFEDPNGKEGELQLKENYNVAILLDSSGSMGKVENGKTRMELAKDAIQQFVKDLPENANVSLRVYGHVGTGSDKDKKPSCSKIEEVYPFGNYDEGKFSEALNQFEPAGWTPMAKAIDEVKADFQQYDGKQNTNIIYVVSDGVETCNGDPVKAAKSLADSNISPVLNIIGYQVDNEGLAQLKEMADASGGNYINARSHDDLVTEFKQTADMAKVWSQWHEDSVKALNDLHATIRDQLNVWNEVQRDNNQREFSNLQTAVNYLHDQEVWDVRVYLDSIDLYRHNYLNIGDESREKFLELSDINTDTFLEKHDEVTDRFLESDE